MELDVVVNSDNHSIAEAKGHTVGKGAESPVFVEGVGLGGG